jgi:hypothetical protein
VRESFCVLLLLLFAAACNPREVGRSCDETADCRNVPSGYCAIAGVCTASCAAPGTACAPDGVCVQTGSRLVCLVPCVEDGDCGAGETCEVVRPAPGGELPPGACVVTNPLADPDE